MCMLDNEQQKPHIIDVPVSSPWVQPRSRRSLFITGAVALAALGRQEIATAEASEQQLHTIIDNQFGRTEITHDPNTLTGNLSLEVSKKFHRLLKTPVLFRPNGPHSPVYDRRIFSPQFGIIMYGLVDPKAKLYPYALGVNLADKEGIFDTATTSWLDEQELNGLREFNLCWEKGKIISITFPTTVNGMESANIILPQKK
jgi:hypothetical protein